MLFTLFKSLGSSILLYPPYSLCFAFCRNTLTFSAHWCRTTFHQVLPRHVLLAIKSKPAGEFALLDSFSLSLLEPFITPGYRTNYEVAADSPS